MELTYAEILGAIATLIGLYGQVVYVRSIFKGQTKPHLFTWVVWGILGSIGFFAQLHDHAGPGAWALGVTAGFCLLNALLALKYGEPEITRGDKIALAASMTAILPWLMTSDPIGSVILISIIDIVAFYPTFRKSWLKPHEENLTAYNLANLKFGLSLCALHVFTINTTLYPVVIILANGAFVIMCLIRRRQLAK